MNGNSVPRGTSAGLRSQLKDERQAEIDAHMKQVRPIMRGGDWRQLTQVMSQIYNREKILFCIDVEAWEKDTKVVTEIGVAVYDPRFQRNSIVPHIRLVHIIIEETQHLKNGRYVPNHTHNFNGQESYILNNEDAILLVQQLVDYYFDPGLSEIETAFVGHDVRGDIKWLTELGLELPQFEVIDTQKLFAITHGKQGGSLKNLLRAVQQPHAFLHNAGNDAYYTVILCLCLSDPEYRKSCKIDTADNIESFPNSFPRASKRSHNQSVRSQATIGEVLNKVFSD